MDEYKDIVSEFYDNLADIYDDLYGEEQKNKILEIEKIYSRLFLSKIFEKGLDYGCGTGISTSFLAKIAKEIYIYDLSEKMIQKTKEKIKNVKIIRKEELDKYEKFFDIILSVTVLQDSKNPEEDLKILEKVLKDDGILILTVLKRKGLAFWKPLIKKYFDIIWFSEEEKDFIFFLVKKLFKS
ncbi:MAG: class I SAM-dependent methyltransferase [Candidatus Aenigmatarchaeota archaeon]